MKKLTEQTKPLKVEEIRRDWYEIDVKGKILGRIASSIVKILQGKHKVDYVPHLDCGDYVVVINAKDVKITGKKATNKIYTRYSGYPDGLKEITFNQLKEKKPEEIIRHAVSGMLPKNKLRKNYLKKLFIYPDANHPYKNKVKKLNIS